MVICARDYEVQQWQRESDEEFDLRLTQKFD